MKSSGAAGKGRTAAPAHDAAVGVGVDGILLTVDALIQESDFSFKT